MSEAEIEGLKNRSELDGMMNELSSYLPTVKNVLIDERDRYLAAKIWTSGEGRTIKQVAIVGAGHLQGIKRHIEDIAAGKESADVRDIDRVPPKSFVSKSLAWLLPLIIAVLVGIGFLSVGPQKSLDMLLRWLLWNGSLAAAGALLALAHPLAILVSFAGAPIGTLSPIISVGLFSGIVQAAVYKPRVTDAESLSDDICSLKGIYRNRITRALLVFFLASIGGAIGNIIAVPNMIGILVK
jgi:pheromone shutdown-related protein TraB